MKSSENVGVILVHGIGEQRRFEHLSGEVRNLIAVLKAEQKINPSLRITVQTTTTRDSEVLAKRETGLAEEQAPVRIDIQCNDKSGESVRKTLHIHEVWWADLDDKATLHNRIRFWFWGLGMWGAKRFTKPQRPGSSGEMKPPNFPPFPGGEIARCIVARLRLFGFSLVFLLSMTTFTFLNFVLRALKLGQIPGVDLPYQYLGDIKLYQDRQRGSQGPLTDMGLPPRIAIRRRMVNTLVTVFKQDYDRWYVLAHSLGSVIALNGLMETAHALPNYLPYSVWKDLKNRNIFGQLSSPDSKACVKDMWPERPLWIEDDNEVLMRKTLFERLRGFVTYGSPLDKYAYLWPQIVNINKDTSVFCEDFEWINVFDHTDPVAAELKAYQEAFGPKKSPVNLAYKASRLLLWSHTRYLALKRKKAPQDLFARRLLDWMLDGKTLFPKPNEQDENWYKSTHAGIGLVRRLPVWILAALLLALLIGCVINPSLIGVSSLVGVLYSQADQFANATQACCELPKATDSDSIIKHAAGKGMNFYKWALDMKWINPVSFVLIAASIFVALAGVIRYLLEVIIDKKHDVAPSRKKQVGDS